MNILTLYSTHNSSRNGILNGNPVFLWHLEGIVSWHLKAMLLRSSVATERCNVILIPHLSRAACVCVFLLNLLPVCFSAWNKNPFRSQKTQQHDHGLLTVIWKPLYNKKTSVESQICLFSY